MSDGMKQTAARKDVDFDPQNMKHRLQAAMLYLGPETKPTLPTAPAAPPPAPEPAAEAAPAAQDAPAPKPAEPAAVANPGDPFAVGRFVFRKGEPKEAKSIMQIRGTFKAAIVTRYVHAERPRERRDDQRHSKMALIPIENEGFSLEPMGNGQFKLKGPGRLAGGVPVKLIDLL